MQEAEGRLLKQRSREFGALDELTERLLRLNHPLGISLVPHAYAAQKTVWNRSRYLLRRFRHGFTRTPYQQVFNTNAHRRRVHHNAQD